MWLAIGASKTRPTCDSPAGIGGPKGPPYISLYKADLKVRRNILSANDGVWHM